MGPSAARDFWLALLGNAADLVVDADVLFPSPRAQSLVVLAQEELGKAVWVYKAFWSAWNGEDERPREVPDLRKQGLNHLAKLIEANDFLIPMVEFPDSPGPVEIELVKAHAPQWLAAHLRGIAQEDNEAKKQGFYVDLKEDGSFAAPQAPDGPYLRSQIYMVASMIQWFLTEDSIRASIVGGSVPATTDLKARLAPVLARGPDGSVEAH